MTTILFGVGLFNYIIDPFHVYRVGNQGYFYTNQRYQNPGLARNYPYDTVLIGTSHIDAMLSRDLDPIFNSKSLRLALYGSTSYEQMLNVKVALESPTTREVIWGLDFFSFLGKPDQVNEGAGDFPYYLYEINHKTFVYYLLSITTFKESLKSIFIKDMNIDERNTWYDTATFSREEVIDSIQLECSKPRMWRRYNLINSTNLEENFNKNFLSLVRKNQHITFDVFLPPYSSAYYEFLRVNFPEMYNLLIQFRQIVYMATYENDNLNLHDFQRDPRFGAALNNYMDMTHFNHEQTIELIEAISFQDYLVTYNEDYNVESVLDKTGLEQINFKCPKSEPFRRRNAATTINS
jgi:hypothetical protein